MPTPRWRSDRGARWRRRPPPLYLQVALAILVVEDAPRVPAFEKHAVRPPDCSRRSFAPVAARSSIVVGGGMVPVPAFMASVNGSRRLRAVDPRDAERRSLRSTQRWQGCRWSLEFSSRLALAILSTLVRAATMRFRAWLPAVARRDELRRDHRPVVAPRARARQTAPAARRGCRSPATRQRAPGRASVVGRRASKSGTAGSASGTSTWSTYGIDQVDLIDAGHRNALFSPVGAIVPRGQPQEVSSRRTCDRCMMIPNRVLRF